GIGAVEVDHGTSGPAGVGHVQRGVIDRHHAGPGGLLDGHRWRWSAAPALGRSTDPPGSFEETPRRPPTLYSVQGDGSCTPTVFPQLQNRWRAHLVAALSCSGLRELALSWLTSA